MEGKTTQLDAKDRKILHELQKGCRRPLGEIARAVGVSKQALHYRVGRLQSRGVIASFITLVDFSRLGYVNHEAWLQLAQAPKEKKEAFISSLAGNKDVRLVVHCGGKFDLLIGILAENTAQFMAIFQSILRAHIGIVKNYKFSISPEFISYPKTHLAGGNERKKEFSIKGEPMRVFVDETERKLLSLLACNARMPTLMLAKKAGVSPATVRAKVKRLEKEGIIRGYSAFIPHKAAGFENYEILATLRGMDEKKEAELEEYCRSHPYSTYLLKCIGRWDIDIGFDAKDSAHFQEILGDFRNRFGGIIDDYDYSPIIEWRKFTYCPF